jgi:type IV secretory pathway component VirB8
MKQARPFREQVGSHNPARDIAILRAIYEREVVTPHRSPNLIAWVAIVIAVIITAAIIIS